MILGGFNFAPAPLPFCDCSPQGKGFVEQDGQWVRVCCMRISERVWTIRINQGAAS